MSKEQNQSLVKIAQVLDSKKEVNNFMATMELIWQGVNLHYLKQTSGDSLSEEDIRILQKNFNALIKAIEPILNI